VKTASPYRQAIFNERCRDVDIMSLMPPPPPPPPPSGWTWTNPFVSKVNVTDPNSATKINLAGIIAGITVPLIVFGLIVLCVYIYCKKKKAKEEQERADSRKKKKDEGPGENKRKKANEFEKSKAERKMDDEILQ
jgi:hypothetical protein